jgi:hypothetical protein
MGNVYSTQTPWGGGGGGRERSSEDWARQEAESTESADATEVPGCWKEQESTYSSKGARKKEESTEQGG